MQRRTMLKGLGAASTAGIAAFAGCLGDADDDGDFPTDDLTWAVGFSEGGATDTFARQMVPGMEEFTDVSVEVDNRPGAGAMIMAEWLSQQEPDGYTIGTVSYQGSSFTWQAEELQDSFHVVDDFDPIGYIGQTATTIIVNRDIAEDLEIEDYGALRDAYQDGEIENFGYQGAGTGSHLTSIILRDDYDLEYDTNIPYDGGGPTSEAVQSGEVAAGFATNTSALAAEESGEAYAVVNLGDVEITNLEMGEDLDNINNYGDSIAWNTQSTQTIVAPTGVSDEKMEVLEDGLEEAVNSDGAQEWAEDTGNLVMYGDSDDAAELMDGSIEAQREGVEDAVGGFEEFEELVEEET